MPLPALLGLPAVISWFSTTAAAVLGWIVSNFTYKTVVLITALTAISTAVLTLFD